MIDSTKGLKEPRSIQLVPCATVRGKIINARDPSKSFTQAQLVFTPSPSSDSGDKKVGTVIRVPMHHVAPIQSDGTFEYVIPPGEDNEISFGNGKRLRAGVTLKSGETLDLGTVDLNH